MNWGVQPPSLQSPPAIPTLTTAILLLQPFYGFVDFVWDCPGEPVPER